MRRESIYLTVVVLVAVFGGIIFFLSGTSVIKFNKEKEQKEIIECLLSSNVKLYIASDCNYCIEQKKIFGEYFLEVNYIDCKSNNDWSDICKEQKINSVPTWVFPSNLKSIKEKIILCSECQKKNKNIFCDDYCYIESEDKKFLKISGILDINKLVEILDCKIEI